MWALILDQLVTETTAIDPAGRFHPDMRWLPCDKAVEPGWTYDGAAFVPPVVAHIPAQVTQSCTPAQGLVALFALKGITEDNVLAAIGQIADPVQQYTARIGYQRATAWERNSPTMQTMAQLLQLSEQDLDALFAYAVTVQI